MRTPPRPRPASAFAARGLLTLLAAVSFAACVDSEITGSTRDVPVDTALDTAAPDADATGFDVADGGCRSDLECADLFGPLKPCDAAVCDLPTGTCELVQRPDCCVSAGDCPPSADPCLAPVCPTPGGRCGVVDACPGCVRDSECQDRAPPCTLGRCDEALCAFEPLASCCATAADCDDADPCTVAACDAGVCRFTDVGGPGCCSAPTVVATSFSPAPPFESRSTATSVRWSVLATPLAPTPPAALYLGDPERLTVADPDGPFTAEASFALGPIAPGAEVELKLQLYLGLLPGPDVHALEIVVRDPAGAEVALFTKGDEPADTWLPIKRTASVPGGGPARLVIRFDSVSRVADDSLLGVLIDDLQVRTACGVVGCDSDAQCQPDDPCSVGRCLPNGVCQVLTVPGCCGDVADCPPAPGPCFEALCLANRCELRSLPDCCQTAADCGPSPDPCELASRCDDGRCDLVAAPVLCDDGDPCTADACVAGACTFTPIAGCCVGPNCACFPDVASYDFEASAQGWTFDPPVQGYGWRRVQIQAPGSPRALYFGNPDAGPDLDPGFPLTSVARSAPIALPPGASTVRLSFSFFAAVAPGQPTDAIRLVAVPEGGQPTLIWQLGPQTPRFTDVDFTSTALTALAGQTVRLRFVYAATDSVKADGFGFLADDLVITADCEQPTCVTPTDCPPGPPCTTRTCSGGVCGLSPILCDDGDPCTQDSCAPDGGCVHTPIPGCGGCQADAQCDDDDPCTRGICRPDGTCSFVSDPNLPGCGGCQADDECDDGDPCTLGVCDDGACTFTPLPNCGGCQTDAQCDDGDPCTRGVCRPDGTCSFAPDPGLPGCGLCQTNADCDDDRACSEDICLDDGTCANVPIPGCCQTAAQCDDGDPCTADSCDVATGLCQHQPLTSPGCVPCDLAACDDGDPCTADSCNSATGACDNLPIAGCCTANSQCSDGDVCTFDQCSNNICLNIPLPLPGCQPECSTDAECEDNNPCTNTRCGPNGTCQTQPIFGCCGSNADCADGDACTNDLCLPLAGLCLNPPVACNDGDACTLDACDPTLGCVFTPVPGCCTSAAQCDDGDACTLDGCVGGQCTHTPDPSCCQADADCVAPDCGGGVCGADGRCAWASCCAAGPSGALCDDGDACTADACVAGVCQNTAVAGCCQSDAQCPTSDDPCVAWRCDVAQASCVQEPVEGCCEEGPVVGWRFDTPTLQGWEITPAQTPGAVTWWVVDRRSTSPTRSLYMGNPQAWNYNNGGVPSAYASTPTIDVPDVPGVELTFRIWLDIETFAAFDPFFIDAIDAATGAVATVWSKTAIPSSQYRSWATARANLSAFAGRTIRLRFRFEADDGLLNNTEGIFIDDVLVRALCAPITTCAANLDCNDGDVCTNDRCVQSVCQHDPIPGCCQSASDCDDAYACTVDSCTNGQCTNALIPGCCTVDEECDDDKACTSDRCDQVTSQCVFEDTGGCCAVASDCDDADVCTADFCQPNGVCRYGPNLSEPSCCAAGTLFSATFPNQSLNQFTVVGDGSSVRWRVHNGQVASPPFALYYGDPATGGFDTGTRTFGTVTSNAIIVPTSAHVTRLEFNIWLDVGSFFFDNLLSARVVVGANAFTAWERTELPFGSDRVWIPISVDLPTQVAGQTIRVQFAFDSVDGQNTVGEGVYVDDIAVRAFCP